LYFISVDIEVYAYHVWDKTVDSIPIVYL